MSKAPLNAMLWTLFFETYVMDTLRTCIVDINRIPMPTSLSSYIHRMNSVKSLQQAIDEGGGRQIFRGPALLRENTSFSVIESHRGVLAKKL